MNNRLPILSLRGLWPGAIVDGQFGRRAHDRRSPGTPALQRSGRLRRWQRRTRSRRQDRVHRCVPLAHLRRPAGQILPVRGRPARRSGSREENRVVLLLHDTVDHPVAFWGAIRAGIVPIPVNTLLTAEQYAYLFADSRAAAAVIAAPLLDIAAVDPASPAAPARRSSSSLRRDGRAPARPTFTASTTCSRRASRRPCSAPTMSDEVAFWMYTSGSTGDPKAVRHVHTSLMATAQLMGQGVIGIREDDVVFSAAKLSFSYGLGNAMAFPMSVGASAVLLPERPTPQAVLATIRAPSADDLLRGAVALCARCSRIRRSAKAPAPTGCGCASRPARRCRRISASAGARWSASTCSTASARPRCCRPSSATGRTTCATARPASRCPATTSRSSTRTAANCRTARSANSSCAGRRPAKATGTSAPRAAAPSRANGPIPATSIVRDTDGYYYCCGRTDDMFKVNGMWVSPFEVEAALASHEAVLEAAVIGKEDADGLIKPKAFIVLKNGYAADDAPAGGAQGPRQGSRRPVEVSALDRQ